MSKQIISFGPQKIPCVYIKHKVGQPGLDKTLAAPYLNETIENSAVL